MGYALPGAQSWRTEVALLTVVALVQGGTFRTGTATQHCQSGVGTASGYSSSGRASPPVVALSGTGAHRCDLAGSRTTTGIHPSHFAYSSGYGTHLQQNGLQCRAGAGSGDRLLQLSGSQLPARPSGARYAGYLLDRARRDSPAYANIRHADPCDGAVASTCAGDRARTG